MMKQLRSLRYLQIVQGRNVRPNVDVRITPAALGHASPAADPEQVFTASSDLMFAVDSPI